MGGIVSAVGAGVTNCAVGDRVFGFTLFGAYSSRVLVPGEQLRLQTSTATEDEWAALPSVAGTALHALKAAGFCALRNGQT